MAEPVTSSIPEHDSETPKRKSGPYNRSKYVDNVKQPRSTLWFNRKSHCSNIELEDDIESDTAEPSVIDENLFNVSSSKNYSTFADDEKDEDENSQDESEDQPDSKKGEPLYEGSRLNLLESMMLLITFVMRHQLSREATKDLLQLVELHCMVPNLCRSSLHNFYSYFSHTSTPVQRHYLCAFCKNYTGTVSNQECLICGKKKERNFMYIPIAGQLQSILSGFSKNDLQDHLRRENDANVVGDVYDGTLYNKLFSGCHFVGTKALAKTKECHISLQLNTDGVSIFRSSSYSVWPLYLIINELNPKQRTLVWRNQTLDECLLLHVWTDISHKTEKYYIGDFNAVLDDRLRALTTPNVINRSPRGITDLKHWKASEYRSFLLFHSVCCLQGILPEEYFLHYMLFVEGIYLLLQSTISRSDILRAKLLLAKFCSQIDYMYAPRYETFNVHSLLHLAEKVDESGPLWCQSCFFFEDLNGDLRSLFHGTTKIELQIASAVVIHQQLPELVKSLSKGSEVDILYQRLTNCCKFKNRELISGHILAVGKQVECQLLHETRQVIEHKLGPVENIAKFYRLLSGGVMFQSKMYLSVTKRNSYTVEYLDGSLKFGQILYFLKVDTPTKCTKYLAVINQFQIVECSTKLPCHFQEVKELNKTDIVEVQTIREMCYFARLTSSQKCFIGKIPVFSESD